MHFLAITRIDGMRFGLVTVTGIGALVVDLDHHARAHGAPVGGERVTLGRDVPALTAPFADAGDDAGVFAVDAVAAEIGAAGIGEIVGGREAGAVVAGCGWTTGHGWTASGVPGE